MSILIPNIPTKTDERERNVFKKLRNLRVKNVDKILIGHLNINSIRNKFDMLVDLVKDNLDVILLSETKIDASFPDSQFIIQGYSPAHRLDRTARRWRWSTSVF